jgi:hypothetical protein
MPKINFTQQERILISHVIRETLNPGKHHFWKSQLPESLYRMHIAVINDLTDKNFRELDRKDFIIKLDLHECMAIFFALDTLFVYLLSDSTRMASRLAMEKIWKAK